MQVDAIRLFCDVAQHRSVSKAAAMHRVTQSAASQRIQALERELHARLIDRSKRPLELTAAGELYYDGCRKMIDRYEQLKRQVASLGTGESAVDIPGVVTIAAIYSAGIDLLNQVKAEFEAEHPKAKVRISYLQPQNVHDRVLHEQCDLGILSYPERWRDLASIPLRNETMVVVARPTHALASAGTVQAAQLAEHDLVSFDPSLPIGRRIRRYLRGHAGETNIVNQFDNIDTIKTFVAETNTVAILPERTVQREVAAGVLATAPLAPLLERPVGIVYHRQRERGAPARAFIEHLLTHQPTERGSRRSDPAAATG